MTSEDEDKSVHLDAILKKFRFFGKYQLKMMLLIGFVFFTNGMHCVNYIFVAPEIPYRCKVDVCEAKDEIYQSIWYNFTAPTAYKNCYKYGTADNYTGCSELGFDSEIVEPCTDWVYEDKNSLVSEFGLACQEWKRTFIGTAHSIGLMIGLFFQGHLSDRIGRKTAIIIAGLAAAVFGIAKSFANGYLLYILLELLEAIFGDNCSPAFIMGIELVHNDYRLKQQIVFCILSALGGIFISLASYLLPYWRHVVRAIYLPSLLFLLYIFLMDESVRWLLSKGHKKKAIKILHTMAKSNKLHLEVKDLENIQYEQNTTKNSPLRETFRSKIVVKRFLVCLVWWMSCTFICFGLMVNVVSLAGNKYLNFSLMGIADIPASVTMVYTLKRFKRKKPLFTSFMVAGVLCLVQPFVPQKYSWLSTGLYLFGRFVTTFTFATVYLYTSELFPTYTRNSMHALCSAIGRIGSIIAPMTPLLMQYMVSLPTLLIGSISIIAGFTTLLVPDLADEPLPDNVKQAEYIGNTNLQRNKSGIDDMDHNGGIKNEEVAMIGGYVDLLNA